MPQKSHADKGAHLHKAASAWFLGDITKSVQPDQLCLSLFTQADQGALNKLPAFLTERVDVNLQLQRQT